LGLSDSVKAPVGCLFQPNKRVYCEDIPQEDDALIPKFGCCIGFGHAKGPSISNP
jgi:hypothetical protein